MLLKKQLLEYELETMLMGADDDMKKKVVYLGRTLEWARTALECDLIEDTCVRCCARWVWKIAEASQRP